MKKDTESYRFPPIVHIQNRLNPDILREDCLSDAEDDGGNLTSRKSPKLHKPLDICRVSPMLSEVIQSDSFIPKRSKIFIKYMHNHENVSKTERGILSPENYKQQEEKVTSRIDKLQKLFQNKPTTERSPKVSSNRIVEKASTIDQSEG